MSLHPDLALSITYFPTVKRLYAVFLGCQPKQMDTIHYRLGFAGMGALQPFTLINTFLEIEKKHRFDAVTSHSTNMLRLVENFAVSENHDSTRYGWRNEEDPGGLVRICGQVTHLRDQLELWKGEIVGLRECMGNDFPDEMVDPLDVAGKKELPLLEPKGYLYRLVREYEARIRVCNGVLATGGLAFQVVSN